MILVEVRAPPIVAGEPFELAIDLDNQGASRAVRGISVRIVEHLAHGDVHEEHEHATAVLHGDGTLPAGASTYRATLRLRPDAAPSFDLGEVRTSYVADVHVDLPWTVDVRHRAPVLVRRPLEAIGAAVPAGRRAGEDLIELDATRFAAGDSIVGNARSQRGRVALVAISWRASDLVELELPVAETAAEPAFALAIPAMAPPSFDARPHALRWELRAGAAAIPIEVVGRAVPSPDEEHALREARTAAAIAAIATFADRRGWRRVDATTIARDDDGGVTLEIALDDTSLRAAIVYPRLGLGLDLVEASNRNERAAQSTRFIAAVFDAIFRIAHVAISEWTDTRLDLVLRVGALDVGKLDTFATAIEDIARTVFKASLKIAPAIPGADVHAWHRLASELDGVFTPGDMSLDGRYEGLPVAVRLLPESELRVTVGDAEATVATIETDEIRKAIRQLRVGLWGDRREGDPYR